MARTPKKLKILNNNFSQNSITGDKIHFDRVDDLLCWDAKNLAGARIHTWPPDA